MAMSNNSNYGFSSSGYSPSGYSPSGYSSPYSSTPTGIRTQRPRFGYSGPTMYPRPRSSASKPNPDSFSDSMINNYGTSPSGIESSYNSKNGSPHSNSYLNSSSDYYTANESYYSTDQTMGDASRMQDNSMMYDNPNHSLIRGSMSRGGRSLTRGGMQNSAMLAKPSSQLGPPKQHYNPSLENNPTGNFQKNPATGFDQKNNRPPFTRKFNKAKRMAAKATGVNWRCDLCSIVFTSQIPYDMHLRGAKHSRKLKAQVALSSVQSEVVRAEGDKTFFCELCNVRANSSLQLQTHLEGSKHKNKLQPKEPKEQSQEKPQESAKTEMAASVNGKTNGSMIRPLPADFGEPQPSKLTKFACDVCNISVNSEVQLQQHLTSRKHQNKIEGKPVTKGKKKMQNKAPNDTATTVAAVNQNAESEPLSSEASTKVVGVKTLASSFVLGETLQ